jgi:hypothetical protein
LPPQEYEYSFTLAPHSGSASDAMSVAREIRLRERY